MVKNEGALSLMGGFTASMMREVSYSGIRLGAYEYFKDKIRVGLDGRVHPDGLLVKIMAASAASSIGSAIANPTDLVKVRMQAYYPQGRPYRTTLGAFRSVFQEGGGALMAGIKSLYRGTSATTTRGVILSVSQICAYDQTKQSLKSGGWLEEGFGLHFAASMFAGLFCSITSNPVDVIKVRLMNDKERKLGGIVGTLKGMLRNEGALSLWKGFSMCWARLGTHTVVTFVVFERFREWTGIAPM
ncbi:mitochondrial carrier [Sistotremastrum suecicum HHB10207 ss-3]|uniref:Mitochondrial carrier n=1 Tax=Sistotremastrum suecicum HHB10207 ss-3 TaxID=1314776 RepID=A0A166E1W1_9AGAM|nr:mitochondrial carrier [Sistotremastrum suecicum HHB10207 ss-3]